MFDDAVRTDEPACLLCCCARAKSLLACAKRRQNKSGKSDLPRKEEKASLLGVVVKQAGVNAARQMCREFNLQIELSGHQDSEEIGAEGGFAVGKVTLGKEGRLVLGGQDGILLAAVDHL